MPDRRQALAMLAGALGLTAAGLGTCRGLEGCDRRTGPEFENETASWLRAIRARAGSGMWLVVRGYHVGDDIIAIASNSPLSHACVLDLEREQVIEALGVGVVATPLAEFLRHSHRLLIIRPDGWTRAKGAEALEKARSVIGKGYDFLGIIGAPSDSRFYCSELALWSMGFEVDLMGPHHVFHPKNLGERGEVLFDSRARDGEPDFA
ncbi:MAG TPA: YiiX/YebB-like N1pC/P60 family cysteine hydrolase [Kofleriaceae bacterium]|nr:YiiX/YebB-like N1pC/P60 family cysteine hydrolase [Kofleriaceae bacterium]